MTARSPAARLSHRLSSLPLPVLLALMLVAGLCALLALNTASAAQELKQRSLTDSNAALSDQEQQLMRDLAAKQAPASLAAAAAAQGLVPNPNPAFLRLNADGSVTVLGSPAAASIAAPPVAPPRPTAAATPTKPAPRTSARPGQASSSAARPGPAASRSASRPPASTARPAPVVTVTVTRPATSPKPSATASPTKPSATASPTKSASPGGP